MPALGRSPPRLFLGPGSRTVNCRNDLVSNQHNDKLPKKVAQGQVAMVILGGRVGPRDM